MKTGSTQFSGKILLLAILLTGCSESDPVSICYPTSITRDGIVTTYTYNASNKVATRVDPDGAITTFSYDSKGNVINSVIDNVGGSPDETGTYTYDVNNRLIQVVYTRDSLEPWITNYTYNAGGQLISSHEGGSNPSAFINTYAYPNTTTRNPSLHSFIYTGNGDTFTATYEYDNKINPEKFLDKPSLAPDNNVIKSISLLQNTHSATATYTYQYNDIGYPISATATSVYLDGPPSTSTIEFTYNCK